MSTRNRRMWRGTGAMLAVAVLVSGCGGGGNQDGASASFAAGSDVLQKDLDIPARTSNALPYASEDAQVGSDAPRTAVTPDLTLLALQGSVVNATTAADQQSPRIAPLAGGGYVVAWSSGSSSFIQRYDAQGQKVGGEQAIGSGWAITGLPNGGYMVGYAARGSESTPYYVDDWHVISVRSYAADGGFVTERTLDSAHNVWKYPFYYSQRPAYRFLAGPSFLYLVDGGVAVWTEEISYASSYRVSTKLQRYDGAGLSVGTMETIGGSVRLTPMSHGGYLLGNQIVDRTGTYRADLPGGLQSVPVAVDSMGDGGYAVVWVSQNSVYAQRLTADGSPVGGRTSLGPVATAYPYYQVLALSDNSFVVIWATTDSAVLRAQRFDVNGNPAGDVLPIQPPVPYTTSAERGVAVAPLSDGGFAVAWTVTSAGGGADVYTQRFVEARPYTFVGFLRPLKNPDNVNMGRAGRVYPLKWQLKKGNGAFVSSPEAVRSIKYKSAQCGSFETALADGLNAENAGKSTLTYDAATNEYHYNWATPSAPRCYILFLSLDSGQVEQAYFDLR